MFEYIFTFAAILISIYIVFFHKKNSKTEEEETIIVTTTPTVKAQEKESKTVDPAHDSKFPITILYGSQSGTAEDLSGILKKEALRHNFKVKISDLETYNRDDLEKEKMVIFLIATYGEGEPTDNSREFYEWLSSGELPEGIFENVSYTVFGLGNTTYEHYNRMGRAFDKLMKKYGAHAAYPKGEGDDNGCLEDDFNNWKAGLWTAIAEFFVLEDLLQESRNAPFVRDTKAILHESSFEIPEKLRSSTEVDIKNPKHQKISLIKELHTEKSDRSCLHIEFDLDANLSYEPGDHLGIYPENQPSLVSRLAQRLGVDLDQKFTLVSLENEAVVQGPCTVRHAFSSLCDITSLPRKNVLKALSEYAENSEEKDFLIQLASGSARDQGPKSYESWIKKDLRNIVEVLEDLPSVKVPFDLLIEILPHLSPRYYSISSSIKLNPSKVSITAALVNYSKPTGRLHDGVCTTWLKQKHTEPSTGLVAPIFLRKSTFRLPSNTKFPVIMVGPGTGLAPFRGFIQERKHQMQTAAPETIFGDFLLFFGCRTRDQDYIYGEELEKFTEEKVLTGLFVAFSREKEEKVYVQHLLKENGATVWDLIDTKGAYFYVCGDGHKMAKDVQDALTNIAIEHGKLGKQQSEDYVHSLQSVGRYLQDVWY